MLKIVGGELRLPGFEPGSGSYSDFTQSPSACLSLSFLTYKKTILEWPAGWKELTHVQPGKQPHGHQEL